ncbi:hypothetical protein HaLaN_22018 [Haematococcus lacustris]|uniref:Methyltransferase FkbM domain-containing protein n=1 Tax=Haematococcus lacustris TaxID=44745 RepID=A0A6A0A092_HAELA|nr:hypothetical protein HaLaN_22018 [Haematococcus lacustris]
MQHDLGFLAHGLGDLSPGSTLQPRHLTVHCIEPSDINFLRLDEVRQVLMHHAAYRPGVKFGGPLTHITSGGVGATWLMHNVAVWTVDKLMQDVVGANTSVLLLKIDTEGWDGLVLQGASKALERKVSLTQPDLTLVDFIIFEYNR